MQARTNSNTLNRLMKKTSTVTIAMGLLLATPLAQADLGQRIDGDAAQALYELMDAKETVVTEPTKDSVLLLKSADGTSCFRMVDLNKNAANINEYQCFVLSAEDRAQ